MSGGFRTLLGRRDTTRFKAFTLAIALQMLGLLILQQWFSFTPWIPAFSPVAISVGGILFGMAMGWSGGCPAGMWYKLGGGNVSVLISLFGMIIGYSAMEWGTLKGVRLWVQGIGIQGTPQHLTLHQWLGVSSFWIALPFAGVLLWLLWKAQHSDRSGAWKWEKTGLWVGVIGLLVWLSSLLSQRPFGMALLTGSTDIVGSFIWDSKGLVRWDLYFVLGVPLGGLLSAKKHTTFAWSGLTGIDAWKRFVGGTVIGVSSSLAGGCTIGHRLAGIPLLSVSSLLFIVCAITGTWIIEFAQGWRPSRQHEASA